MNNDFLPPACIAGNGKNALKHANEERREGMPDGNQFSGVGIPKQRMPVYEVSPDRSLRLVIGEQVSNVRSRYL
jgi:hypothetical protein